MDLNELLILIPSVGMATASILLWRKQRDWVTASMASSQCILLLNVLMIFNFLPPASTWLNSISESLLGNTLAVQRIWFHVARAATLVFATAFILFSVRYVRNAKAR